MSLSKLLNCNWLFLSDGERTCLAPCRESLWLRVSVCYAASLLDLGLNADRCSLFENSIVEYFGAKERKTEVISSGEVPERVSYASRNNCGIAFVLIWQNDHD